MNCLTYKGKEWQVQVCAWDLSDSPDDAEHGKGITFSVLKAPATHYMRSPGSFTRRGEFLYFGEDLTQALDIVERVTGEAPDLPDSWRRYLERAA